jgi:hypothetical protein
MFSALECGSLAAAFSHSVAPATLPACSFHRLLFSRPFAVVEAQLYPERSRGNAAPVSPSGENNQARVILRVVFSKARSLPAASRDLN